MFSLGPSTWHIIKEFLCETLRILSLHCELQWSTFMQGQSAGYTAFNSRIFQRLIVLGGSIIFMILWHAHCLLPITLPGSYKWVMFHISKGCYLRHKNKWYYSHWTWSAFGCSYLDVSFGYPIVVICMVCIKLQTTINCRHFNVLRHIQGGPQISGTLFTELGQLSALQKLSLIMFIIVKIKVRRFSGNH